ncbi:hypothetical protein BCU68_10850 [Vibrio sp. 10N.286.49.B3]|uniref:helix-turn-helix transcriptional regulator n=1 Tax=Vibrio sp. 10N.286.49.B3 TaxID=1880855 RepID=UPI000C84E5C5|nr:WYL domain-containing protein [Vibrio sp. 10N.286.49.B3]PMH45354.1 hypothetical protein BCU68_10850 [Vibrio sp. 10N.286.49.B3]
MSQKTLANFYAHQFCLNLLAKRKNGLNQAEFFKEVQEQQFYHRESAGIKADTKWVNNIFNRIYEYHGEGGSAPGELSNLIEYHGTRNKGVYKVKPGKELPLNLSFKDSYPVMLLVADNVQGKLPPTKGESLKNISPLVSEEKVSKLKRLYVMKDTGYEVVAPVVDRLVLENIEAALESRSPLSFRYSDATRHVDPYGLFVYGKVFYLVGREGYKSGETEKVMTGEVRTYAIHRISDSENHKSRSFAMGVNENDHFSVEEYLSSEAGKYFNGGLECEVVLKMKKNRAGSNKFVDEYKLSECQEVQSEDETHYILKAKARDCLDFQKWLITNANSVEILSPPHIRAKVVSDLKRAVNNYAD